MDRETLLAWVKIVALWLLSGWNWAVKALPTVALMLTITFTCLQIYILWRDKLRKARECPPKEHSDGKP